MVQSSNKNETSGYVNTAIQYFLAKNVLTKVGARTFLPSIERLHPIISHPIYRSASAEISPRRGQTSGVSTPSSSVRDRELFPVGVQRGLCETNRDTAYFSILRFTATDDCFSIIYRGSGIRCAFRRKLLYGDKQEIFLATGQHKASFVRIFCSSSES